jgi:nucleoside-diphosphate-sugar epimerase
MRVGVYQRNPWHTEIIGPLYYMLRELGYDCVVYNDGLDKVDYLPFYKTLFPEMEIRKCVDVYKDIPTLDYVILLTIEDSIDNTFVREHVEKIIFMTHLQQEVEKAQRIAKGAPRITLTPLVKDSEYILPVYRTQNEKENLVNENTKLAIIGWCDKENKDFEDISNFLENNKDKQLIIFSKQTGKIEELRELCDKHPFNLRVILNCDTPTMIKILQTVDYIWIPVNSNKETSVHIKDRSTGALPLSYNLEIPIIVPRVFNDIYKLEGNIVYEESIREVDLKLERKTLVESLKEYKKHVIKRNLEKLRKILKERPKCLITGGCGFVGRYFSEQLMKTYNVTIVDNMESTSAKEPGYAYIKKDIVEYLKESTENSFDLVIHLAAVVGGRQMIENEPFKVSRDLIIDAEFFSWVAKTKPKKVIYFSSSAVYPIEYQTENNPIKLREEMVEVKDDGGCIGVPDLTYGWAKLTGEFLAKIAHKKYDIDIVCYRPFSGYGETQHETYPFPSIISRVCRREDPLVVWSNSIRDFVHIEDIYNFVMETYNSVHDGSAINIGSGRETSFVELAKIAAKEVGYNPVIKVLEDKPKGVYYRVAEASSLKQKISLEEGIRRMVTKYQQSSVQINELRNLSLDINKLIGIGVGLRSQGGQTELTRESR